MSDSDSRCGERSIEDHEIGMSICLLRVRPDFDWIANRENRNGGTRIPSFPGHGSVGYGATKSTQKGEI